MNIKVINVGNCLICGREIKIVTKRESNKLPNIFFCPRCEHEQRVRCEHEQRLKKGKTQEESEVRNDSK